VKKCPPVTSSLSGLDILIIILTNTAITHVYTLIYWLVPLTSSIIMLREDCWWRNIFVVLLIHRLLFSVNLPSRNPGHSLLQISCPFSIAYVVPKNPSDSAVLYDIS
jgi:hypothetical protein